LNETSSLEFTISSLARYRNKAKFSSTISHRTIKVSFLLNVVFSDSEIEIHITKKRKIQIQREQSDSKKNINIEKTSQSTRMQEGQFSSIVLSKTSESQSHEYASEEVTSHKVTEKETYINQAFKRHTINEKKIVERLIIEKRINTSFRHAKMKLLEIASFEEDALLTSDHTVALIHATIEYKKFFAKMNEVIKELREVRDSKIRRFLSA
jgi:hypothetical protein